MNRPVNPNATPGAGRGRSLATNRPTEHIPAGGLSQWGIDPNRPPDARAWSGICMLLNALIQNPHLQVGADSSQIVFPQAVPGISARPEQVEGQVGPFTPRIVPGDTPETFKVACTSGAVIERRTLGTDDVPTLVHVVDPLEPTAIEAGKTLAVRYPVNDKGRITGAPAFEVVTTDAGLEVGRYFPPVGASETGTDGAFIVPLASFDTAAGSDALEIEMLGGGSHITHFQDLPTLRAIPGGDAAVLAGYDPDAGRYDFRPLAMRGTEPQVTVGESGDKVVIEGNGVDAKLYYKVEGESDAVELLGIKDGLVTTEDPPIIPIPAAFVDPGGGTGTLVVRTNGESEPLDTEVMAWAAGRVQDNGERVIGLQGLGPSGDDFDVEFTTLIFFQDAGGVLEVSEDTGVIREFHVRGGAWRIGPSDDDLEVRTLRIPGRIIAPNDTGDPFPEPP